MTNQPSKIIAIYFPQFHKIPENDRWWGLGFTDWNNVKISRPQFQDHYQPRVPLNKNYYDQSDIETLRNQVQLAKKYGIYGFCHYHYWFDGKQLLETPTNLMLQNLDIDLPFCLSWANETWSRRWDGQDNKVLIQQTHPANKESWKLHYDYLIKAWKDPRAIKVNGKPVFIIYRPQHINKIDEMLSYWRGLALKDGLPGLYFIYQKQYDIGKINFLSSFDAIFQFQPGESVNSSDFANKNKSKSFWMKFMRNLPENIQDRLRSLRAKFFKEITFYDYDEVWKKAIEIKSDQHVITYPGAYVDWDNGSRYKERATIFRGATPEKFEKWLHLLIEGMPQRNLQENFIFLNAWNEWSEGAYLEPDERFGYDYLEAVRRAQLSSNRGI